jgi:hypothetical protein
MVWKTVTYVRADLYEAVWSTPVTKVAKTFGISDVALRKVCQKLGVPLPAAGHWAKVAHGKPTRRPPLPKGDYPAEYRSTRQVEPEDEELRRRLAEAPPLELLPVAFIERRNLEDCHRLVQRTAASLAKGHVDERGWPMTRGANVPSVCTTPPSQHRALMALDLVLQALSAAGLKVLESDGLHVVVEGYRLGWRLSEYGRHIKADTANVPSHHATAPGMAGTGKLHLDFVEHPNGRVVLTLRDTASQSLEQSLTHLPQQLLALSAQWRVRDTLREEREQAEIERRRERVRLAYKRKEELERLANAEQAAQQWHRARVLREYATALRAAALSSRADHPESQLAEALWIEKSADWLDPVVKRHWPEVDDAPSNYW